MKLLAVALLLAGTSSARADDAQTSGLAHAARAEAFARSFSETFLKDPMLISAVRESTALHRKLSWEEQRALDRRWKDERADRAAEGLYAAVTTNALSKWLKDRKDAAPGGAVSEIHVIDGLGWNVGQTADTADFFQGDEIQWQNTLPGGPNALVVSELEDNGTGNRSLAIVSLPLVDGQRSIGTITLGIDVEKIP